jgi:hypothetical protein
MVIHLRPFIVDRLFHFWPSVVITDFYLLHLIWKAFFWVPFTFLCCEICLWLVLCFQFSDVDCCLSSRKWSSINWWHVWRNLVKNWPKNYIQIVARLFLARKGFFPKIGNFFLTQQGFHNKIFLSEMLGRNLATIHDKKNCFWQVQKAALIKSAVSYIYLVGWFFQSEVLTERLYNLLSFEIPQSLDQGGHVSM